jgi:hypothetical protein
LRDRRRVRYSRQVGATSGGKVNRSDGLPWLRFETGVFVVLVLALLALGPAALLRDPGMFWHLRVGEHILETGTLVRTDFFSSTFHGHPWLTSYWVFETVQALVQRIDGFDTLLLFTAVWLAALYAWIAARYVRRGIQAAPAAVLIAFGIAASAYQFQPRPLLVSFAAMAWLYARLVDFEAGRVRFPKLLALIPLIIVWTNSHGAVLGGLASLLLVCGGWIAVPLADRAGMRAVARPLFGWPTPLRDSRAMLAMAALTGAACASVLVNPYGVALVRHWFAIVGSPLVASMMMEHAPLDWADPASWNLVAFGVVYFAALAGVPWRKIRVTWLVPAVWFVMACSRVRHGPLFAVTATIALAEMYGEIRWRAWLVAKGSELLRTTVPRAAADWRAAVLPIALVAVSLTLQVARIPAPLVGHGWARLDPAWWPVELLPELQEYERTHPRGTGVFNEMLFGGFLIHFTPGLGVFVDDRCELYGDERLGEYAAALGGDMRPFDEWQRRYGFDLALTIRGSSFDRHLRSSSQWQIVKESAAGTLFRRTS